jgi:mannan endo-1,4-beta-mannosidase
MNTVRFVSQSIKFCFVILLVCVITLGASPNVMASTSPETLAAPMPASSATTVVGFHVSGRYLLDATGENFVIRGINHPHAWYPTQTSSFANIKAKGANTIRVVLSGGQRWTKNSATDVANVINLCKANKLVCMLEMHDTTGYGEQAGAASLAQAVSYWKEIKSVLIGQEAYVLINIGNEPYGNIGTSNWINDTKNVIQEMRNAGFQHTLIVDAPNWGQDWQFVMRDNAASVLASDPLGNTMFSIHMYGVFDTPKEIEDYIKFFYNANLALLIGEFGYFHSDGDPAEDAIMSYAQTYGIGYLGWSWSGNSSDVSYLDMVTNFDPNQETWWGNRIIRGANGLLETSVECHCYNPTFTDVPVDYWSWNYIERLSAAGITSGCSTSPRMYCPGATVTRDQMAVFLLRGKHSSSYVPPTANGVFSDVPTDHWAAAWIEQLAAEGITSGCSVSPKLYCPGSAVTRDQMAVFLLRAKHGSSYTPPPATGVFQDVPTDYWSAAWIEQLAAEGITSGCSVSPKLYCPATPVTRDQMAVFLVRNFSLP